MPVPKVPYLPPAGGGFDFAPVPEGESGLDIQISPGRMGGAGNNFDSPIAGARLQNGEFFFNFSPIADMIANPNNYRGTFLTDFSGTILAGIRLDGAVPTLPVTPWVSAPPVIAAGANLKNGLSNDIKIVSGSLTALPGIYSPGGGAGLDVFFTPSFYPTKAFTLNLQIPTNSGGFNIINLINANIPVIYNNPQIIVSGYTNVENSNLPLKTRPRPEGYNTGERGLQLFITQLGATTIQPAPFEPLPAGFPYFTYASAGLSVPYLRWFIN
jgi:hypothetical protein